MEVQFTTSTEMTETNIIYDRPSFGQERTSEYNFQGQSEEDSDASSQASLSPKQNAILTPDFSLDEELLVHEIHQARIIINTSIYENLIQEHSGYFNIMMNYFVNKAGGGKTKTHFTWSDFERCTLASTKVAFAAQGHLLMTCLRKCSSGIAGTVMIPAANCFWFLTFSIYIYLSRTASCMTEQELVSFPVNSDLWRAILAHYPAILKCSVFTVEHLDKDEDMKLWANEGIFVRTMEKLGLLLEKDEKLISLYIYLLFTTPRQSSRLFKNKNLKSFRSQVASLMYRYKSSQKVGNQEQAAADVHDLRGLIEDIYQCSDIFTEVIAKSWNKKA